MDKTEPLATSYQRKTEPGSQLNACCAAGAGDGGTSCDRRPYDVPPL